MNMKAGAPGVEEKSQVLLVSVDVSHSMPVSSLFSVCHVSLQKHQAPCRSDGKIGFCSQT